MKEMLPGLEGENIARLEEEVAEGGERGDLGRKPALTQLALTQSACTQSAQVYKECSHTIIHMLINLSRPRQLDLQLQPYKEQLQLQKQQAGMILC